MAAAPTNTQSATTTSDTKPSIQIHQPHSLHPTPKTSKYSLSPLNFSPANRSPSGSMPSSPTSIHSSSSAIFERDIEQPLTAISTTNTLHKDPHHTARALAHEPLDNAVPSVLAAAVAALGEVDTSSLPNPGSPTRDAGGRKGRSMDEISVIVPSPLSPANWTTAPSNASVRHGMSRSPSPSPALLPSTSPNPSRAIAIPQRINTGGTTSPDQASVSASFGQSDLVSSSAVALRGSTPSVIGIVPPTPNVNNFGFNRTAGSSPQSATASPMILTPPLPGPIPGSTASSTSRSPSRPTSIAMSLEELSLSPMVAPTADSIVPVPLGVEPIAFSGHAHPRPPSPNSSAAGNNVKNRLSFISYNDLLNSTPISSYTLGSVASSGTSVEPPHQIDVTLRDSDRSRATSRQSTVNRSPISDVFGSGASVLAGATESDAPSHLHSHDVGPKGGGEWQREGFGTGLEERLETALSHQSRSIDHANSAANPAN